MRLLLIGILFAGANALLVTLDSTKNAPFIATNHTACHSSSSQDERKLTDTNNSFIIDRILGPAATTASNTRTTGLSLAKATQLLASTLPAKTRTTTPHTTSLPTESPSLFPSYISLMKGTSAVLLLPAPIIDPFSLPTLKFAPSSSSTSSKALGKTNLSPIIPALSSLSSTSNFEGNVSTATLTFEPSNQLPGFSISRSPSAASSRDAVPSNASPSSNRNPVHVTNGKPIGLTATQAGSSTTILPFRSPVDRFPSSSSVKCPQSAPTISPTKSRSPTPKPTFGVPTASPLPTTPSSATSDSLAPITIIIPVASSVSNNLPAASTNSPGSTVRHLSPSAQSSEIPVLAEAASSAGSLSSSTGDTFKQFDDNTFQRVAEIPVSTFSANVDTSSYSYVRRMLEQERQLPSNKDAVRVEEMINYFDYEYPAPTRRHLPFEPSVRITKSPLSENRQLLQIGIKGYELTLTSRPKANLVFLLDVSSSMSGKDRLPLIVESIRMLLKVLNQNDQLSIVTFATTAQVVLKPTATKQRSDILAVLDRLHASGDSGGSEGLKLAYNVAEQGLYKDSVNRIFLATDGDFHVGAADHIDLERLIKAKRDSGIYLSVLGVGMGNYRDDRMKLLAEYGNGVGVYIDTLDEAQKILIYQASSTFPPIAKDVKIQVEFNPRHVEEYRLIGYEKRMLQRRAFSNDKVDAGDIGAGHTVTAMYELTLTGGKTESNTLDPLRYGPDKRVRSFGCYKHQVVPQDQELGFLKIRYKLPNEETSQLLERPILKADQRQHIWNESSVSFWKRFWPFTKNAGNNDTPDNAVLLLDREFSFATAVAMFAQTLRTSSSHSHEDYDKVIELANENKGPDPFGYRAAFVQLVRKAQMFSDQSEELQEGENIDKKNTKLSALIEEESISCTTTTKEGVSLEDTCPTIDKSDGNTTPCCMIFIGIVVGMSILAIWRHSNMLVMEERSLPLSQLHTGQDSTSTTPSSTTQSAPRSSSTTVINEHMLHAQVLVDGGQEYIPLVPGIPIYDDTSSVQVVQAIPV